MGKDLRYYMNLPYTIIVKPYPDGEYYAKIEELPGCMTEGHNLVEALEMLEDAKRLWLETALEDGISIPEPAPVGEEAEPVTVHIPIPLHRRLLEKARREGVSLERWVVKALTAAAKA